MTGAEFKACLRLLGRTQVGFAAEVGVAPRTVHYWAQQGPPSEVGYLIEMLTSIELPFGPGAKATDGAISSADFRNRVIKTIDRLGSESEQIGRRIEFEQAIATWVKDNTDS